MNPDSEDDFARKLQTIQSQIGSSKLLIVSKTRPSSEIERYYKLGHRDFGENRVQDLLEKALALKESCPEIRWHMIGHLQSNKVNQLFIVPNLWAIHSVDNFELIQKLVKNETKLSSEIKIFLEVNTSKEVEKSGFEDYDSLLKAASSIPKDSKIKLFGLMTMGTIRTESLEEEARRCFKELNLYSQKLSSEVKLPLETSMGMSQDYHQALLENSNWIRLGTMMFS